MSSRISIGIHRMATVSCSRRRSPTLDMRLRLCKHMVSSSTPPQQFQYSNSHPDTSDAFSNPSEFDLSCPPAQKQCNGTCIPSTQDCCAASEHCLPEDYCYHHSGSVRCCPEGLACFQISGDVCFERTVVWYEEVHIVDENEDEIITSWHPVESVYATSSRITITASYPAEGRASFTRLSWGIVDAAATPVALALDEIPTRTVTLSAHTTKPILFDTWSGPERQVVLDL
ncbi:hypothetical protein BDW71DRAFT_192548 [Aspergillus fruticulosus]